MVLLPTINSLWRQSRLTAAILLTVLIMLLIAIARLIFMLIFIKRAAIVRLIQSRHMAALVKASRLIIVVAYSVTLILSFMPKADLGLAGILLFIIWPVLAVLAFVGTLKWEKFILQNPVGVLLYIGYVIVSTNVVITVLRLTGYLT